MIEQSKVLPKLTRPIVIHPSLSEIPEEIKFDRIIGRNALGKEVDKLKIVLDLVKLLNEDGKIILGKLYLVAVKDCITSWIKLGC